MKRVLDFFSSIWTGVALLALLFVYCSIGSAGVWLPTFGLAGDGAFSQFMVRQYRGLEMTEYEWFHWWPFNVLIILICVTLVTTTIRRISLRPVNYGVWMIHSGIIILALGSVIYYSTKVEGDAPVARRQVVARVGGSEPVGLTAIPGNSTQVGSPGDPYELTIASVDPHWEILSGDDKGGHTYSVNVMVRSPDRTFIRQLLAGYPQYTEDLVRSTEPGPPWTRAVKALGTPIVDETLELSLDYDPQKWFYLSNDIAKSWALYVREVGEDGSRGPWFERSIDGLPLYNDYVADPADVWPPFDGPVPLDPLAVVVGPAGPDDPLGDVSLEIDGYLRYAVMDTRRIIGGDVFDPTARVLIESADGRNREYQLVALDPEQRMEPEGRLVFEWVESQAALDQLLFARDPVLSIRVPGSDVEVEIPVRATLALDPALDFTPIGSTEYGYRVQALHDGLRLSTGDVISVAAVEVRTPQRTFVRWVSDDPARTRDMPSDPHAQGPHGETLEPDPAIEMEYVPGVGPAPITIVAGPGERELRLVLALGGEPRILPLAAGAPVSINDALVLTLLQYAPYTSFEAKPLIVPPAQRNRDVRTGLSMIHARLPAAGGRELWLHYHQWPVEDETRTLGRMTYRPTEVLLDDGRLVELMFSRRRLPLPAPVILDDFVMDTHLGGFTGQTISVRNWTSEVRFRDGDEWGEAMSVRVNEPKEFGGLSYFQAQWDPPDPGEGYAGLNFTVLGVGNRHGVNIMLLGCCVTVLGMIYAFYVKPVIKRRQQREVYERIALERGSAAPGGAGRLAEPAGAVRSPREADP